MAKKTTQNPEHKWKVGTWYKNPMGYMINYQRGNHAYGFQAGWKNNLRITPEYLENNEFIEATKNDVLWYLRHEAIERGFVKDAMYKSIADNQVITIELDGTYFLSDNLKSLTYVTDVGGYTLLIGEKWAEVVTEAQPSTENQNPTELIADFSNGVIGRDIEHTSESIFDLYYTQPVPEFKITLVLSIWGNTTISYNLGFLYGGDNNMKYGYYLKTATKAGWDKKSVDWFDSLLVKAFNEFIKSTSVIKVGTIPKDETSLEGGDSLTIFFDSNSLLNALTELRNNFLEYNNIDAPNNSNNEYATYTQDELKVLLKAFNILSESGNDNAKKEIVILQTLITEKPKFKTGDKVVVYDTLGVNVMYNAEIKAIDNDGYSR
jgi:hypothetical protein